ncbi:hypothetical protein DZF96_14785, partial [Clavibacter michiganensis]
MPHDRGVAPPPGSRTRTLVGSKDDRAPPGSSLDDSAPHHVTSGPQPAQPLDADDPARVRLASGAVPSGDDGPGPAVALVRAALAETP